MRPGLWKTPMTILGIKGKISRAKAMYRSSCTEILADRYLQQLLSHYRAAVRDTQQLMVESGVVDLCSVCASKAHGSCCAKGVEDWYDEWLLFINLLMGIEIESPREEANSCLFVGSNGCKLAARHSFCVNFLCPAICGSLGSVQTGKLLALSGTELYTGWILEQELRKWLKRRAGEHQG